MNTENTERVVKPAENRPNRAQKKALKEQTAKIFAERLGADNVVVTSIQQFISREDDAED